MMPNDTDNCYRTERLLVGCGQINVIVRGKTVENCAVNLPETTVEKSAPAKRAPRLSSSGVKWFIFVSWPGIG